MDNKMKSEPLDQEHLNYEIVRLLATNSIADILELLSEHCGIQSERVDTDKEKTAYLMAMRKIQEANNELSKS
jgi:hypothetical protein